MANHAMLLLLLGFCIFLCSTMAAVVHPRQYPTHPGRRQHVSINDGWRFWRFETNPDGLAYDNRTDTPQQVVTYLRPHILPSANEFILDPSKHYEAPPGIFAGNVSYAQGGFDDSNWEDVSLPHDWAINGPFYEGDNVPVTGGMGRLPVQGVGWYRRKISVSVEDDNKVIYLDIDGAMSYAIVWLNGNLVGGWPYGYNSFRLDLTPYLKLGDNNQLAIRLVSLYPLNRLRH